MEKRGYTLLLVDDEVDILEFLRYTFEKEGYAVRTATNGQQALALAQEITPDVILLDIMMPEMDGVETCMELRKIQSLEKTMIVFLTARNEDYSQIAGFHAGADDYVAKPIKPSVLLSRIEAVLRRRKRETTAVTQADEIVLRDLLIDKDRFVVIVKGKEIRLSKKEFDLLVFLTSKTNRVFSRSEILSAVWDNEIIVGERTIDVHIRRLRNKLQIENIKTYKGVGYQYEE